MSCDIKNGVKEVIIMQQSDINPTEWKNGRLRLKRKYGKFTRPVLKFFFN